MIVMVVYEHVLLDACALGFNAELVCLPMYVSRAACCWDSVGELCRFEWYQIAKLF